MSTRQSAIDLSEILRPYEYKWVAITKNYNKVIASGQTLKETIEEARKKIPHQFIHMLVRLSFVKYSFYKPVIPSG